VKREQTLQRFQKRSGTLDGQKRLTKTRSRHGHGTLTFTILKRKIHCIFLVSFGIKN